MKKTTLDTDVLVVGGGLAGLCAALAARRTGARVAVAAKGRVGRSGNTVIAKNGVAAVLRGGSDGDSPARHAADTLRGGAGINDPRLVDLLATRAGETIRRLVALGVPFAREAGTFLRLGSPGHSRRRLLRVETGSARAGGLALTLPLLGRLGSVTPVENVLIAGLLTDDSRVTGAWGLSADGKKLWVFRAAAVILACGGIGRLFPVTTNAAGMTGDGYALAHLAGARLRDMEFIQFHPVVSLGAPRTVVSTAVFADGAVLRNAGGDTFMDRYSPQGHLATRDVMARACRREITAGRGTPGGGVYLDLGPVPPDVRHRKYPDLAAHLSPDATLEAAPAAHFMMGGVSIDERGRTTLPGLFAAGETVGGVHGANRLAGNALTEAAVFGFLAGEAAGRHSAQATATATPGSAGTRAVAEDCRLRPAGGEHPAALLPELQWAVGAGLSLERSRDGLEHTLAAIENLTGRLAECRLEDEAALVTYHQMRLMLVCADLVARAALARPGSLGAHFRAD